MKRLLLLAFVGLSFGVSAQQNPGHYNKQDYEYRSVPTRTMKSPFERYTHYQITARYGVASPLGSLKDYAGGMAKYHYNLSGEFVTPKNYSFGLQFNYSYFKDRLPRRIYTSGNQDISSIETHSLGATSFHAFGKYHFASPNAPVRPYAMLGLGATGMRNLTYYGYLEDGKSTLAFSGQAGVGARFLFAKNGNFGADVQATYFYSPFKSSYVSNVANVSASAGLFYRWW
ncbi:MULTISPECIES: OmpA family protein [unclassified Siphonobacter]|uniref:OmpA family protein n=1 Tax=unclassified Siphonobacter TaxID=2635712 RepID=UPI000CBD9784|nr:MULTISPECIES: OmpA family protein [unclassified Siphonobacter]MDQ1086557.1 hypothetical protein [Siphonobacter sp. SORGH_AS_1065]MDR6196821.1 hypothetical protein [Siphonobacter sp. SORGH_AS_0500]PKK36023.1 hypothetical protein BWI96_13445 [Siphonobacter sp. SORGH_AS_0500]